MSRAIISPAAAQDLDEILATVAQDGISRAELVAARLRAGIDRIAHHPLLGHQHSLIDTPTLRVWVVRPYLIVYRHSTRPIEVVRILHGARDLAALFDPPT